MSEYLVSSALSESKVGTLEPGLNSWDQTPLFTLRQFVALYCKDWPKLFKYYRSLISLSYTDNTAFSSDPITHKYSSAERVHTNYDLSWEPAVSTVLQSPLLAI